MFKYYVIITHFYFKIFENMYFQKIIQSIIKIFFDSRIFILNFVKNCFNYVMTIIDSCCVLFHFY